MDDITLRAPHDDDWPSLLELANRSISEAAGLPSQHEWANNRRSFPHSGGFQEQIVAIASGRIAGYAALERRNQWAEGDYRIFVVAAPSDRDSIGARLLAEMKQRLLRRHARRAWFLEYEADSHFNSWLERAGFIRAESFTLADGAAVVRLVANTPFEPGVPATHASASHPTFGARFLSRQMAENYRFRPPYSREVYDTLLDLFGARPRILLDVGCGPGKVTLGLIDQIDRADAIDPSAEMLRVATSKAAANRTNIRWINAKIEDAALDPPYGLIVCGLSIHWTDLDRTLARFAGTLAPGGFLALLEGDAPVEPPWEDAQREFMVDFIGKIGGKRPLGWKSARHYLAGPILLHPRFQPVGEKITAPMEFSQSIPDYIRCQHSRATWSEEHLGESASAEFDRAMTALLSPYAAGGMLRFAVQTRIEWGRVI